MSKISYEFIATGGSRHPAAADWDLDSGLLAYGADRNVALWIPDDPHCGGVHAILRGHTDTVNAVKFFPMRSDTRRLLFSGSLDKTIRVWVTDTGSGDAFREAQVLLGHQKSLSAIAVLRDSNLLASASADARVKIWILGWQSSGNDPQASLRQDLRLDYLPLALDLAYVQGRTTVVLAVAGTRSHVQLFVSSTAEKNFTTAATLTGHEGWIRSLSFVHEDDSPRSDLLLASASQDKYIRLWRIHKGEELPAVSEASHDSLLGSVKNTLFNKAHRFSCGGDKLSATFEALLVGHEDWIYSARWSSAQGDLRLLSASADNSLAIWALDVRSGIWTCTVRIGDINAQKGATTATGSSGGLWNGLWSPDADSVAAIGRTGSWRVWRHNATAGSWVQDVATSGHTREVQDIVWAPDGSYLLSTSSDQTTRLFAEWNRQGTISWHEMSRPQIHGYNLNCVDVLNVTQFISGADEKPLRVFDMPNATAELLSNLSGYCPKPSSKLPEAANIPVMGLSNKAIDSEGDGNHQVNGDVETKTPDQAHELTSASMAHLDRPPSEDQLGRHLLWPEREKLYGHGYEVCAVASSRDATLIASACRASSIDHAVIRGYKTSDWQQFRHALKAHSLTVTSLEFSCDDMYLLSVGRDRQCFVFERDAGNPNHYSMFASDPKAHSRMILDASWAPVGADGARIFATAGRDKRIHIWTLTAGGSLKKNTTLNASSPVTAVAFAPNLTFGCYHLAFGLEDGLIGISKISAETLATREPDLFSSLSMSRSVMALAWRPGHHLERETKQLAAAGEDSSVRIYRVDFA